MIVPIASRTARAAPDLHEAHAALEEAAGEQATPPEFLRHFVVEAVKLARRLALAAQVERRRRAKLHSGCEFISPDARFQTGVGVVGDEVRLVERAQ